MPVPDFDPKMLSVEERLALIDRLWLSIAAELDQRVEAFKRDPSKSIRWEDLRAELNRKYG